MAKGIGAVLAGLVAIMVLVMAGSLAAVALLADGDGAVTPGYLAANIVVSFGAAVAGGWLAARLAPRRPLAHASALAGVLLVLSLPGMVSPAEGQPAWYPYLLPVIGVSGVLIGGVLRERSGRGEGEYSVGVVG